MRLDILDRRMNNRDPKLLLPVLLLVHHPKTLLVVANNLHLHVHNRGWVDSNANSSVPEDNNTSVVVVVVDWETPICWVWPLLPMVDPKSFVPWPLGCNRVSLKCYRSNESIPEAVLSLNLGTDHRHPSAAP